MRALRLIHGSKFENVFEDRRALHDACVEIRDSPVRAVSSFHLSMDSGA